MSKELTEAVIELREQDALQITDRLLAERHRPPHHRRLVQGGHGGDRAALRLRRGLHPRADHGRRDHEGHHRQGEAAPRRAGRRPTSSAPVVLCTVQGDIHDIGKDIVATMLDIAGFDGRRPGRRRARRRRWSTRSARCTPQVRRPERPAHRGLRLDEGHAWPPSTRPACTRASRSWSAARRSTRTSAPSPAPTAGPRTPWAPSTLPRPGWEVPDDVHRRLERAHRRISAWRRASTPGRTCPIEFASPEVAAGLPRPRAALARRHRAARSRPACRSRRGSASSRCATRASPATTATTTTTSSARPGTSSTPTSCPTASP